MQALDLARALGPPLLARRTSADVVADSLRAAINSGSLADGTSLSQAELAAVFGVSRVPVREAMRQLQAEGLIDAETNRVAVVRATDIERLVVVFELRALLEGWLTDRAVPRLTSVHLDRARELNDQLRSESDHLQWLALNTRFHEALYVAAEAETAMDLLTPLWRRCHRYTRMWSGNSGVHDRETTWGQHDEIVSLAAAGRAAEARAAAEAHVMDTCRRVTEVGRRFNASRAGEGR